MTNPTVTLTIDYAEAWLIKMALHGKHDQDDSLLATLAEAEAEGFTEQQAEIAVTIRTNIEADRIRSAKLLEELTTFLRNNTARA